MVQGWLDYDRKLAAQAQALKQYVLEQAKAAEEAAVQRSTGLATAAEDAATSRAEALLVPHFWSLGEQLRKELGASKTALEQLEDRCTAVEGCAAKNQAAADLQEPVLRRLEECYSAVTQRLSEVERRIAITEQHPSNDAAKAGVDADPMLSQLNAQVAGAIAQFSERAEGLEAAISKILNWKGETRRQLQAHSELIESHRLLSQYHTSIAKQRVSDLESRIANSLQLSSQATKTGDGENHELHMVLQRLEEYSTTVAERVSNLEKRITLARPEDELALQTLQSGISLAGGDGYADKEILSRFQAQLDRVEVQLNTVLQSHANDRMPLAIKSEPAQAQNQDGLRNVDERLGLLEKKVDATESRGVQLASLEDAALQLQKSQTGVHKEMQMQLQAQIEAFEARLSSSLLSQVEARTPVQGPSEIDMAQNSNKFKTMEERLRELEKKVDATESRGLQLASLEDAALQLQNSQTVAHKEMQMQLQAQIETFEARLSSSLQSQVEARTSVQGPSELDEVQHSKNFKAMEERLGVQLQAQVEAFETRLSSSLQSQVEARTPVQVPSEVDAAQNSKKLKAMEERLGELQKKVEATETHALQMVKTDDVALQLQKTQADAHKETQLQLKAQIERLEAQHTTVVKSQEQSQKEMHLLLEALESEKSTVAADNADVQSKILKKTDAQIEELWNYLLGSVAAEIATLKQQHESDTGSQSTPSSPISRKSAADPTYQQLRKAFYNLEKNCKLCDEKLAQQVDLTRHSFATMRVECESAAESVAKRIVETAAASLRAEVRDDLERTQSLLYAATSTAETTSATIRAELRDGLDNTRSVLERKVDAEQQRSALSWHYMSVAARALGRQNLPPAIIGGSTVSPENGGSDHKGNHLSEVSKTLSQTLKNLDQAVSFVPAPLKTFEQHATPPHPWRASG